VNRSALIGKIKKLYFYSIDAYFQLSQGHLASPLSNQSVIWIWRKGTAGYSLSPMASALPTPPAAGGNWTPGRANDGQTDDETQ